MRDIGSLGICLLLVFGLTLVLAGCRTVRTEAIVPEVRADTCFITKVQRDSILQHDSIHVWERQRGDTVYVEVDRWRTRVRVAELHDTVYVARRDSIPYPVETLKEVPRSLTWWQMVRMRLGETTMAVLGVLGVLAFLKMRR